MNFDQAFETLIGHEGGHVDHPLDPGRETKYGISKRAYPRIDIAALTLDAAKAIYRRDYWDACAIDALPEPLRYPVFDMAVNSGKRAAAIALQRALAVQQDGLIGPITRRAIQRASPLQLAAHFCGARLAYLATLPTWPAFGRGWTSRVADNLMNL